MTNMLLNIVAAECRSAVESAEGTDAKLRAAMKAARYSMARNDDEAFRGAIAAVCLDLGAEHKDYDRIMREVKILQQFSAMSAAAMAGLNVSLPEADEETLSNPIGLMKIWHETKQ